MKQKATAISIVSELAPFISAAKEVLPVLMLRRYSKWTTGNQADVANALRSECQTLLGDLVLALGPVKKSSTGPKGRRPENTTWYFVPTLSLKLALIIKNVRQSSVNSRLYLFLTESSPEISGSAGPRLLDVPSEIESADIVVSIERTKMTQKKPAWLAVKVLIGVIDHENQTISVEDEIPIFSESLAAIGLPVYVGNLAEGQVSQEINVPVSRKSRPKK